MRWQVIQTNVIRDDREHAVMESTQWYRIGTRCAAIFELQLWRPKAITDIVSSSYIRAQLPCRSFLLLSQAMLEFRRDNIDPDIHPNIAPIIHPNIIHGVPAPGQWLDKVLVQYFPAEAHGMWQSVPSFNCWPLVCVDSSWWGESRGDHLPGTATIIRTVIRTVRCSPCRGQFQINVRTTSTVFAQ